VPDEPPTIREILEYATQEGASDVHITVGIPAQMRVQGVWEALDGPRLTPRDCETLARSVVTDAQWELLVEKRELDVSCSRPGIGRFRVNVFFQRDSVAMAIRVLPFHVPKFGELGLPVKTMERLCVAPFGIVFVCGPTGSGKSTTLASMIGHINENSRKHIMTIEDPIEFLHNHRQSIVDQREVGSDTLSFTNAMKYIVRQNPDVVLVGEIRDQESVRTALLLAETGHLVFTTVHAGEVTQALSRMSDMFPADQQVEIRLSLSLVLQAVVAQQLVPTATDATRALAYELLLPSEATRNLVRTGKFEQIYSLMQTRQDQGMQTMNQSLHDLWRRRVISRDAALTWSPRAIELERVLV
jgi:twitching motility protein PilT